MSRTVFPRKDEQVYIPTGPGALSRVLKTYGKLPPVSVVVKPLDGSPQFFLDRFTNYSFNSNILIPVDTFNFGFTLEEVGIPTVPVKCGDIIIIKANQIAIGTGIVDQVEIQTDAAMGTSIQVTGRDMLGQLEDNDAVSLDSSPLYAGNYTVSQVFKKLIENTRIPKTPILNGAPSKSYLFATQPGETKISSFQRYVENLNILFWSQGDGSVVIGKPNMWGPVKGRLFMKRSLRDVGGANVLSMRSTRASTQIPNIIATIWNGQEEVQHRITKEQILYNRNRDPIRLRKYGHRVIRSVVTSTPQGSSPQDLGEINLVNVAGSANLLQAKAKMELAKANISELKVEAQVAGHYNENAEPFSVNQVYRIQYEPDGVDENMFLYNVDYSFNPDNSQITNLHFCRQLSIVSDLRVV